MYICEMTYVQTIHWCIFCLQQYISNIPVTINRILVKLHPSVKHYPVADMNEEALYGLVKIISTIYFLVQWQGTKLFSKYYICVKYTDCLNMNKKRVSLREYPKNWYQLSLEENCLWDRGRQNIFCFYIFEF